MNLMRFAPGVWRYALPPFALAVPATVISPLAAGVAILLGLSVLAFFRDPDRHPPADGILAPADGRVTVCRREGDRVRVGVFMNVTNVHVIRAPQSDAVVEVTHEPGANRPAFSKDSERNERLRIDCEEVTVILIAGAFARRITPYIDSGERLVRGERIGHIAFGSRVDVILPPEVTREDLAVERGDRVRAGETVIVPESARP